jgi:hypothetical protein
MDLDGSVSNVHCAYGCSNGACLNETEQRAIAPYDSDGGNNPFVKGKATCIDAGVSDVCTIDEGVSNDPNQLMEFWCNPAGKNLNNGIYNCSNGCLSGACINQIPSTECQKIIGDANFGLGNDIIKGYKFVSNYSYPEEYSYSDLGNVTIYYSFYKDYANNKQMTISAMSIDDKSRLMKDTQWYKDYLYDLKRNEMWEVGHVQFYVGGDLQTQEYYIINGRNKEESTLLWPSENSLIIVENYDYNGQIPGVNDVNNFLDSLKNNKFTYVYTDAAVLDDLNSFASRLMPKCQSPVSESCSPSWAKKIEPVVCPEYGYQREIVNDNAGCSESHETQIYCSPGICSGCYVPRWFSYYNNGNNICMPYGTRFIFQDGQTSKIYEDKIVQEMINESGFDAKFEIRNDGTAFAQIKSDIDLNNLTNGEVASVDISYDGNVYHAKAGESLVIYPGTHQIDVTFYDSHGDKVQSEAAWVEISKIFYSDDPSQRYIEVVNRQDYPAYCDVDGWVKRQKDLEGSEWARCQNNYECQSNLCSYGECINTKALIGEARGFKGFVVKVLCKLSNVFDNADYNQCVVNNS